MCTIEIKEIVTKITKLYHLKPFCVNDKTKLEKLSTLEKSTKTNIQDIPVDDNVISLFCNTYALNTTSEEILRNTGALRLGIFNNYDILLSKEVPKSLEELKNILSIHLKNKSNEKNLWDEVLYAYYLGYYKYYYPLDFYKMLFDNDQYYLNTKVINKGYESVRKRILELNDVAIEPEVIIKKKSILEIAEEEGLEIALEILARGINIHLAYQKMHDYYKVKINKFKNELIIIMNEKEKENV